MRNRILLCSAAFAAAAFGCLVIQRAKSAAAFAGFEEAIAIEKYDVADAMLGGHWDVHLEKWSRFKGETRITLKRQEQSFFDWLTARHAAQIDVSRDSDRFAIGNTIGIIATSSGIEITSHREFRNDYPTLAESAADWTYEVGFAIGALTSYALNGR